MTLWDDLGGRTWIERAGPRTAVAEARSWPRRRRTRVAARVVRRLVPPERPR